MTSKTLICISLDANDESHIPVEGFTEQYYRTSTSSHTKWYEISNEWSLSQFDLLRTENLIRPHAELRSFVFIHSNPLHSVGGLVVLPWH